MNATISDGLVYVVDITASTAIIHCPISSSSAANADYEHVLDAAGIEFWFRCVRV